jgi:hypothetical protein
MNNPNFSMTDIIYDVDLAIDVKSFVLNNLDNISWKKDSLKDDIINSNDDDLIRIGKTINSPLMVVSVDKVDATFFKKYLFKKLNEDGNKN